ncbi:MAG: hypothetical protein HYR85_12220 [Planctomycetes bacterium]|nr:hypothetical protein [Planctomycetota bacterium]MBI3843877.1 hypothetical protein [Planctomycetota bacterium]
MKSATCLQARWIVVAFLIALGSASPCHAQNSCGEWTPGLFPFDGPVTPAGAEVHSFATFDDGTGPALYVGGVFIWAGGAMANDIAKWNGTSWSPLGTGIGRQYVSIGDVTAMAVFDDGTGPALYVGGDIQVAGGMPMSNIVRWNGSAWSAVGEGLGPVGAVIVTALIAFDDGSGPALYAGGYFGTNGLRHGVVRWDGHHWSQAGSATDGAAHAFAIFDDGTGPALYAGGDFNRSFSTATLGHVARWNGSDWSSLAGGVGSTDFQETVRALAVFDDGSGPALFAAGSFNGFSSGPSDFAKWNGTAWSGYPVGLTGGRWRGGFALAVYDDGNGPALYTAGDFHYTTDGVLVNGIARWTVTTWAPLSTGVYEGSDGIASALTVFDNGTGPALYVGGGIFGAGDVLAHGLVRWNGTRWSRLESGSVGGDMSYGANAFRVFDDGSGPALFIGGSAISITSLADYFPRQPVVKWTGSAWIELPRMDDAVQAFEVFDDGSGPALYVAGKFTTAGGVAANRIARWDGVNFIPLGTGLDGLGSDTIVRALRVFDDGSGPGLYAAGDFTQAGGAPALRIARWNGTSWSPLAGGIPGEMYDAVDAMRVYDDGSGPALYVGGDFSLAHGAPADGLVKWDGTAWSEVGGGINGPVESFAVWDDGNGPALYMGGIFNQVGSIRANFVARWNGTAWSALGDGVSPTLEGVLALRVFDDGTGQALYASGSFSEASGVVAANSIARWNGSSWSALGSGMIGRYSFVRCLEVFNDGDGPALYAGGAFPLAGGSVTGNIARWKVSSRIVRHGDVNAGGGSIRDVLFVNGSAGDADRVVNIPASTPIDVHLDRAPNGPVLGRYVLWAWASAPSHAVEVFRGETRLGCFVNPTPIQGLQTPQPFACLRSPQLPSRACRGVAERPGPATAPFTIHLSRGLRGAATVTLQAILEDDGAADAGGWSSTNATIVHAQ